MTKTCKKILLSVFLALCFVLCLGAFAACGGDNGGNNGTLTYTVTVQLEDGTPAKGVRAIAKKGNSSFGRRTTVDADGKVSFELAPDDYTVELSSLPAHYSVPSDANLSWTKENRDITVTLAKNFFYTVKLVNPDGTPYYAKGVTVGVCTLTGNCHTPVALGENGVAEIEDKKDDYHVQILGLPADVRFDCDSDGYYTGENFSATKTEMTITIYPVESATLMTDAEKEAYASKHTEYNKEYTSYKFTKEIPAKGTTTISFTATLAGRYYIFKDNNIAYRTTEVGGYLSNFLECQANETYTIIATNNGNEAATTELVIAFPFSSYIATRNGNVTLTSGKENTYAIVAYTPSTAGTYTATVQGDATAVVKAFESAPEEFIPSDEIPQDNEYVKSAKGSITIHYGNLPIYFAVAVKANSYPVNVDLKIEKTAASNDTYTHVAVTETLTQQTKPEGKELYGIPMDGTSTGKLTYDEGAKAYRYGEGGPIVYVKLTKPLDTDRFAEGCSLAYMELVSTRLATYIFVSESNGAINTLDYTIFLRGFDANGYISKPNNSGGYTLSIPTEIATETYYAKFVNEDGAYPLTKELKDFLEKFYEANETAFYWSIPEDADLNDAWLFPCYYYGEQDTTPADPIVGEYTNDDGYKLAVNKNGTFTIYRLSNEIYSPEMNGTWSKDENEKYTFTEPNGLYNEKTHEYENLHLEVTIEGGKITLNGVEDTTVVWEFEFAE